MKKLWQLWLVMGLILAVLVGCSSNDGSTGESSRSYNTTADEAAEEASYDYDMATEEMTEQEAPMPAGTDFEGGADLSSRKIIETRTIDLQTENFDTVTQKVEDLVYMSFGYIERSSVDGKSFYDQEEAIPRTASYTLRVPAEYYVDFVDELVGYGYVIENAVNIKDVTNEYMDIEARIETLEIREDSLRKLLENSEDLETILVLEEELSQVRYEVERYMSSLNNLDNLVQYSTVYLTVEEVFEIIEKPQAPPKTYGEKVASGFTDTLEDIGRFFQNLSIWLIVNSPYLIMWVVFVIVVFVVVKRLATHGKRKAAKEAAKAAKLPESDDQG